MAKYSITIEDNENSGGVNIRVQGSSAEVTSASRLTSLIIKQAELIAQIPMPKGLRIGKPCDCETCQAMAEKIATNPTLH